MGDPERHVPRSPVSCSVSLGRKAWWEEVRGESANLISAAFLSLPAVKLGSPKETWRRPKDFPGGSDGKESACNAGDLVSIPGCGRSRGQPTPVFLPGDFHGQSSLVEKAHKCLMAYTTRPRCLISPGPKSVYPSFSHSFSQVILFKPLFCTS